MSRQVKLSLSQQMHGFDVVMGGAMFQAEGTRSETAQLMVNCLGYRDGSKADQKITPSIVDAKPKKKKKKKMLEFIYSLLSLGFGITE